MSTSQDKMLKFSPMQSFVHNTFWHKLAEIKLEHDRLSDASKPICGFYTNYNAKGCFLELDYSAFNNDFKPPKFCHIAKGILYNKNTIEEFKECDKTALLDIEGRKLVADFKSGHVLDDCSSLARFFVLSFGDLKCHSYYYWFAFPCPLTPTMCIEAATQKLQNIPEFKNIQCILNETPIEQLNFFILKCSDSSQCYTLKEFVSAADHSDTNLADNFYCFADASDQEHPSWLLRTYAVFLLHTCPFLVGKTLKFLGLRFDNRMDAGNSLIWTVRQEKFVNFDDGSFELKFVGWELNQNKKMTPRFVSMEKSMDPEKLAESSINLNLKLMKWRLVPELNLDIIANTKCLLFGAGTLGCAVARNLLAWGFKHITFVDSGKVGYSNPVRQNLYTHADAAAGNKMKAVSAAEHLKQINPNAITTGYVMQIPMPGHTVGASMREQTIENLSKIKSLIEQHDVIFLLTDSRESRWLPTLLGAVFNKIVINAALGFDSYLIMRHGSRKVNEATSSSSQPQDIGNLKCIEGADLGCYFCNDVTAPGNSLKERTLDQQCTVTRPGVSNIAASYAVEILVSLLQHPLAEQAPAYYSATGQTDAKIPEGLLGIIPHSIRGMLFNYQNILPATRKFMQCIACSEIVLSEFRKNDDVFLFKAFETAKYLEDLTGISAFNDLDNEIIDYEDSDEDT